MNVVDALQRWEESRADKRQPTFFWFDIFSNSQHKSSGRKYEWWIDCFREAIGRFGRTLLVLEWDNPIPLSRIWCVWELACTVSTGAKLEVIMNEEEELTFGTCLTTQFDSLVARLSKIDVEHAEAHLPSDVANIQAAIRATAGGYHETNKQVIGALRSWMAGSSLSRLRAMPAADPLRAGLLNGCGQLYREFGMTGLLSRCSKRL